MLSQTSQYALKALGYIAKYGGEKPILARTISQKMDIPSHFLSKIMHRLVQSSYLSSSKGINGGFKLTKDAHEICLYEIASLFMNVREFDCCFLGSHECNGSCAIHNERKAINDQYLSLLKNTTIDLVL
jgi:Rrf2 family iron-sulfur cluster assembly transcriptional regulator